MGLENCAFVKYNKVMKTGIFGGAFDPPHVEHINICLNAAEEYNLERVVLLPSGNQPHKASIAPQELRYNMAKAAAAPYSSLIVDDTEINYKGTAFASDILPLMKEKYGKFFYIIGGDSLMSIRKWHRPDLILSRYPLLVALRGEDINEINNEISVLKNQYNADIEILKYRAADISSSEIRAMLELEIHVSKYLPQGVLEIIKKHNLYSGNKDIIDKLKGMVRESTFRHIGRTVLKAFELNEKLNLPYEKVFIAALLHDVAKDCKPLNRYRALIPEDAISSPVMHAFQGALIAELEFGITDSEVLNAIRYHTTGRAGMTGLESLIFVSDMLEEERDFQGVERLREVIRKDYRQGVLSCIETLYHHLKDKKAKMYPLTEECYNYYKKE